MILHQSWRARTQEMWALWFHRCHWMVLNKTNLTWTLLTRRVNKQVHFCPICVSCIKRPAGAIEAHHHPYNAMLSLFVFGAINYHLIFPTWTENCVEYKSLSWEQFRFRRIFIFLKVVFLLLHTCSAALENYHCSESGSALVAHIRGGGHPVCCTLCTPVQNCVWGFS